MSQKKTTNDRLQSTLTELDFAISQWDSLTSKPSREQVVDENGVNNRAKCLLEQLRDQIENFENLSSPLANSEDEQNNHPTT